MKDVTVLGLTVNLFGVLPENSEMPNLGALTLSRDSREYILDVVQSYTYTDSGDTEIECKLVVDRDTFEDCPYDLTAADLMSSELKAEFWIESELEIDKMSFFVKLGEMTKAIDVTAE